MSYSVYYRGEITITPSLTKADAAIVRAFSRLERTDATEHIFSAIAASPEPDLPRYDDLFGISEDRAAILPEEDESRHGLRLWLVLLVEYFLRPAGYVLNGEVSWTADEPDDRGCIFVKDNCVEAVEDVILNAGPSWSPDHYADERLKQTLRELVDSADAEGCSSDLTVVSAKQIETLRRALPRI